MSPVAVETFWFSLHRRGDESWEGTLGSIPLVVGKGTEGGTGHLCGGKDRSENETDKRKTLREGRWGETGRPRKSRPFLVEFTVGGFPGGTPRALPGGGGRDGTTDAVEVLLSLCLEDGDRQRPRLVDEPPTLPMP